jgi:hypothetical protein
LKKIILLIVSASSLIVLQNCSSTKKASASKPATVVSYEKDIMPMLKASCTPCHFPPDGSKQALNTYADVTANFDEILIRVKLPKDDLKFMPFRNKKPALGDSGINVLVEWQKQNMPQ